MKKTLLLFSLSLLSLPAWADETGSIFVKVTEGQSGQIFIDGEDTGKAAPATLEGVSAGNHMVQVKGDCVTAAMQVDVAPNKLARAELDLQPLGGLLQITSRPSSASIVLDGKLQQNNTNLNVSCGEHTLEARSPGYISKTRTLDVEMGGFYSLEFTLYPEGTGSLSILVEPVDAAVFLDGSKVSDGPTTIEGVDAGAHTVAAEREGYDRKEEALSLSSGEEMEVKLKLSEVGSTPVDTSTETTAEVDSGREWNVNGRRLAGGGLALVGAGLAVGGVFSFGAAMDEYEFAQDQLAPVDFSQAEEHYNTEAVPLARRAYLLWALGGAAIAGGGTLFFIEDGAPVVGWQGTF